MMGRGVSQHFFMVGVKILIKITFNKNFDNKTVLLKNKEKIVYKRKFK